MDISEDPDFARTRVDARRHSAMVQPFRAEVAFFHNSEIFAKKAGIIRTRNDAISTAHTIGGIDDNDAVRTLAGCPGGANSDTGGFGAVMALFRLKGGYQPRPFAAVLFIEPITGFA
jgi:hypothetical protein